LRLTRVITLATLIEAGEISSIEVELGAREQRTRLLYGTPGFVNWLKERLRSDEPSPLFADLTPNEQLDLLFYDFLSGKPLVYTKQFRVIKFENNAVWELKTPDLRIFGWFAMKDCFIAVFGDWAWRIKEHALYRGYRIEVKRFRRRIGAEDGLCVRGVTPGDVISL
jgi:hypothetical protein